MRSNGLFAEMITAVRSHRRPSAITSEADGADRAETMPTVPNSDGGRWVSTAALETAHRVSELDDIFR